MCRALILDIIITLGICCALLSGCALKKNLSDGYQVGDVIKSAIEDKAIYCAYEIARARARILAGIAGYPLPDICKGLDSMVVDSLEAR
ncbi:MAG: hypothetical protein V3T17_07095 [Pseudomonadales bacterium]